MVCDERRTDKDGNTVAIRPACPADAEEMAHVSMRAWHLSLKDIVPQGFLEQFQYEKQVEKYVGRAQDPEWLLLVAEFEGKVVGMIGTKDNDSEPLKYEKQIKVMYVDPALQNRGIGKALLVSLFDELKKQGLQRIMLWCIEANKSACSFYEKRGGRRIEPIDPPEEYAAMPHVAYTWDSLNCEGSSK